MGYAMSSVDKPKMEKGTMQRVWLFVAGLLICLSNSVSATELAGVELSDQIEVGGKKLLLNGLGIREGGVDRLKVYVAGLYLETKTKNHRKILRSKKTKKLVLKFLMSVQIKSILDAWEEGFAKHAGSKIDSMRDRIDTLKDWMSPVGHGDTYEFDYQPKKGIEVFVKGKKMGLIPGEDFAKVFFSIWLGNPPLNYKLRNNLVGRAN